VYWAQALADPPTELPSLGPGLVYLDPTTMLPLPAAVGNAENVATTLFDIPNDPAQVGQTYYFQALAVNSDAGWSEVFAQVTVLP
jgi:hypothetical protein